MQAKAEEDAILQEQLDAENAILEQEEQERINKERKEKMMKKLKTFLQNAMWIKLKAIK